MSKYEPHPIGDARVEHGLGTKMVIFCIGEAYDELSVHRKRLCGQSILFGNAFAVPSDEFLPFLQRTLGVDTTINQYTGAIVMTVLVEYLYSGSLPNPLPFAQFHALYRLADAFQMPVLQNKLLDLAQEKHIVNGTCFDAKEIAAIYNHREKQRRPRRTRKREAHALAARSLRQTGLPGNYQRGSRSSGKDRSLLDVYLFC
ncbi:hypothetical protein V8E51_007499 [Hyaloscypha variabilis]